MREQNLQQIHIATVTEVVGGGVKLHFRGELAPRTKVYSVIGAMPSVDDRVAVAAVGGTYVVLGGGQGGFNPDDFLLKSGGTITGNLTVNGSLKVGTNNVWHAGNVPIEEGGWTPFLFGTSAAGNPAYIARYGSYRRVGKTVYVFGQILISSKGGMVGEIRIGGLPIVSSLVASGVIGAAAGLASGIKPFLHMNSNTNYLQLSNMDVFVSDSLINDATSFWSFSVTYPIA